MPRSGGRPGRAAIRLVTWAAALVLMLTLPARALSHTGWAMDTLATFAAQFAAIALLVGFASAALRAWAPGAILFGVAMAHWLWLVPGRADWVGEAGGEGIVSVVTFNALAMNTTPQEVVRSIVECGADVAVVIEAADPISKALEASPEVAARYPSRLFPRPGVEWSVVVLSRWPQRELDLREAHPERRRDWKFNFTYRRARVIERPGGPFLLTAFWPDSPKSPARWVEGNAEARELAAVIRECLIPLRLPIVVCTDLNATPSGYRTELIRRLTNLRRAKPLTAMRGTWPSWLPPPLRIAIDDVLVSSDIAVAFWSTLERETGSDHVPVLVRLDVPRAGGSDP